MDRRISGKVIVAGPANVGKTCLLERFVRGIFVADSAPTLGCDCMQKSVVVDGSEVSLYLYDTAGQERFADMAANYYRSGDVCLLCFDVSSAAGFDQARWWRQRVAEHNDRCSFIMVATKEDLIEANGIDVSHIREFASKEGMPLFLTSALTGGDNIDILFRFVAEKCKSSYLQRQLDGSRSQSVKLAPASAFGRPAGRDCACGGN
mmetsp:Transcript_16978/g.40888  ORF Transcript_16978/g.40888 Transcript_16978/m.40888 type:complete len:206 (-) Transcript_16978:110-727(-)